MEFDSLSGTFCRGLFQHPKGQKRHALVLRLMELGKFPGGENFLSQLQLDRSVQLLRIYTHRALGEDAEYMAGGVGNGKMHRAVGKIGFAPRCSANLRKGTAIEGFQKRQTGLVGILLTQKHTAKLHKNPPFS